MHYVSDSTTVDGRNIHPGYMAGRRVHDSEWNWPQWEPPANSWSTWSTALRSYLGPILPTERRAKGHQKVSAWTNDKRQEVKYQGVTHKVSQKHERKTMNIIRPGETFKGIPCDVHEHRGTMELLLSRYTQKIETDTDTEEVTFLG